MPKSRDRFQGLLSSPPQPLADDGGGDAAAGETPALSAGPERRPEPAQQRSRTPRSPRRTPDTPAVPDRVALTVRLHEPAARALNDTWLDQRRQVNPKLSYPEFASEIVRLGLAAFARRAKGS